MQFLVLAVILCVAVALLIRRNREHTMNAPLRSEIKAQVCFATALRRARILGRADRRGHAASGST